MNAFRVFVAMLVIVSCTPYAIICLAHHTPAHHTRLKVFQLCDTDDNGYLSRREFIKVHARYAAHLRRYFLRHFKYIDSARSDGKLSLREFLNARVPPDPSKEGAKKINAGARKYLFQGNVIFPTNGDVVDVDEFLDEFEVIVLPPNDPEIEYQYWAKTIPFEGTIPGAPPQDADAIDTSSGMYLVGWVDESKHSGKYADLGDKTKALRTLIVWEKHRDLDPEPGEWSEYTYTTKNIHVHTANLYPTP